jgi:hypothetical protein
LGQIFPVVLIHDAGYTTGYNMEAVQRIHFTDWCDPTVAAQAMGRAQRIGAAKRLPPDRREAVVFTYSVCGDADGNDEKTHSDAGAAMMRTLDREIGDLGEAVVTAHAILRRLAADEYERFDAVRPMLSLARQAAEGEPGRTVSETDYRMLLMADQGHTSALPLSETLRTRIRDAGQSLARAVPQEACEAMFGDATTPAARLEAAMAGWKYARPYLDTMRSPVRELAADLVRELDNMATRVSTVARGYGDVAAAMQVALSWRGRVRPQALGTIDEMLAAAYAAAYEPVLRLYEGMMRASVSCALYAPLHATRGQLPGLPQKCGIPQKARCLSGATPHGGACGRDSSQQTADVNSELAEPIEALGAAVKRMYERDAAEFDEEYKNSERKAALAESRQLARQTLRMELRALPSVVLRSRAQDAGVTVTADGDDDEIAELVVLKTLGPRLQDPAADAMQQSAARKSIRREEKAAQHVARALGHVFDRFAATGCERAEGGGCSAVRDIAARLRQGVPV